MKESDIKKMSLAEINEKMGMSAALDELSAIINVNDSELLQQLLLNLKKSSDIHQLLQRQFKGDESKIDKVALIIITLNSYLRSYNDIVRTIRSSQGTREDIIKREKLFQDYINEAKNILRDIDVTVFISKYDSKGNSFIEALNSQELVTGQKRSANRSKLKEIEDKDLNLMHIANSIVLTDLANIVCDPQLGSYIRYQAFYNTAMEKGIVKDDDKLVFDAEEQIDELRDQMSYEEMIPHIAQAIDENIEYIDFEKLLLCSAFRHIEFLEQMEQTEQEDDEEIARRLRIIQDYLKGKNVRIHGKIERQDFDKSQKKTKYMEVSYKVKDFEKDMENYRGTTYFGKARIKIIKEGLLLGKILFKDIDFKEFKLNTEEIVSIAVANEDNYIYLIENGLMDNNSVNKVNKMKGKFSLQCLQALLECKLLDKKNLVDLFMEGKVELESIKALDIKAEIKEEDVYLEFTKEDNKERQERIAALYKQNIEGQKGEERKEIKEKIYDAYLNSLDAKYLEVFLNLGAIDFNDLRDIMTAEEWMEALERKEITEEFFFKLQENKVIEPEEIKQDEKIVKNEILLWEKGVISSEQIKILGISIDQLLEMCEQGEITGKRINELLHSEEERDSIRRRIRSNYAYGVYNTIKPGFACYNNNLINRDNIINLINQMGIREKEIVEECMGGMLSGEKIAELHYQHLISKKSFLRLKENGLVTDEEEINVLNNLTPEEMIAELEENGCEQIVDIEEILRESTSVKGQIKREPKGNIGYRKQVINPIARNKLLEVLGADKIVTTPEQGFKGYQVYLIPKLNIAVMEKMFRVSKDGDVKPSYGDATYVCELGKFLMVAGQSKQEIRAFMDVEGSSNGNVEIVEHRKNWGRKLVDAIAKVNTKINIQKDKSKKVQQIAKDDSEISIDLQKLNSLVEQISYGDYSLYLEDYE